MKSFLRKSVLVLSMIPAFLTALGATGQSVEIPRAQLAGPFRLMEPLMMDSVNKDGKKFSLDAYLTSDVPNTSVLFSDKNAATLEAGAALPKADGETSLVYLRFTLTAPGYAKGKLEMPKIKHHKVFLDGRLADGELKLEPMRHDVTIACLVKKDEADTFSVKFTPTVGQVTVNAEGKRPYTLNDITDGLHYTGVSLSYSGKYALVGYSKTFPSGKTSRFQQLVELKTGKTILPDVSGYTWCRDRDALFQLRQDDRTNSLVMLSVPDFKEEVLVSHVPTLRGAQLSPDLKYIIYTSDDAKGDKNKEFKHFNMPDDRLYNSLTHQFLHLYDLQTGGRRQLTYGNTGAHLYDISDDGKYLLFSTHTMVLHRYPFNRLSLFLYEVATGRVDTLLTDTMGIRSAQFSPDGRQLMVTGTADAFGGVGKTIAKDAYPNVYDIQLFVYDLASRTARPLTRDFDPAVARAVWSRYDGNIYFTADNGSKVNFYGVNPKTGDIRKFNYPIDNVQSFAIAKASPAVVLYGQGASYARRMVTADLSDKRDRTAKFGNIDFEKEYADVAIPQTKVWDYRSSRGDTIRGFYYMPPNFDETKRYPVIVYYYGGCTPTQERLEMNYPFAVWASQGYIVYIVEPSGAIGFGQEFASRHVNTWGTGSSDDILEGAKGFCRANPFADSTRVACIGASYGGFMTEYLLTRTDFFRTAVAHAGISDLTGYWGAGNWGYTYNEVAAAESYPWNNRELYVDHSPLYHADKITTPLLLVQGSVDTNVPANQAWQLYTALKILNKPVEFVQVQGENHVISDYNRQKHWQKTICAWFAKWLKDEPAWWEELYR